MRTGAYYPFPSVESAVLFGVGGGGADAEASYGNVQIEIGSNNDVMFRGKNATAAHLGLCGLNCTMTVDGETVLKEGEFIRIRCTHGRRRKLLPSETPRVRFSDKRVSGAEAEIVAPLIFH